MPIMDGLESARSIREFEKKAGTESHVKIVALTGVAQTELQRDTIGSGMDMFLTKPIRMESLIPLIEDSGVIATGLARMRTRRHS
jgi:CheY-like chemotaxis protein